VAAPEGTDYRFFFEAGREGCRLTLYARRRGFVSYTNNLTGIASRPLPECTCRP
jgi:hypothetical protein